MGGGDLAHRQRLDAQTASVAESAKWLVAALAGLGAALIGGLQVARLGALEGTGRIVAASLGATAGVCAVIGAVLVTVAVMLPRTVALADVRRREDADENAKDSLIQFVRSNAGVLLRSADDTVGALERDYVASLKERKQALDVYYADPRPETLVRAEQAGTEVIRLNEVVLDLLAALKLEQTRNSFQRAKIAVALLAAVVAIGVVAVTWSTNAPDRPSLDLRGANLKGAQLPGVELRGVDLDGLTIDSANFYGSYLGDASTAGTKWKNTTCPDGTNSDNAGKTCAGHLTP